MRFETQNQNRCKFVCSWGFTPDLARGESLQCLTGALTEYGRVKLMGKGMEGKEKEG